MDSPASSRGRGRSSTRKRHTLPGPPSSQRPAETIEHFSFATPAASMPSSSFTFETPSPSSSRGTRTRTRNVDGVNLFADDADSKGGRSLRKRARVDYTFEHADQDMSDGNKAAALAPRALKKRRTDSSFNEIEMDDEFDARVKRRASEQPPSSSSAAKRRPQQRKSTVEPQVYVPDHHIEDAEVQDTIEVGGHFSEGSDESALRRTSSGSSSNDTKSARIHVPNNNDNTATNNTNNTNNNNTNATTILSERNANHITKPGVRDQPSLDEEHIDESKPIDADLPVGAVDDTIHPSYDHLTPYIDGSWVYYPAGEPEAEPEPEPDAAQEDVAEEEAVDDQVDGLVEDTPAGSPGPAETAVNSPAAELESSLPQSTIKKQIPFKQIRQASDFTELFEDLKSLTSDDLWRRLEVTNRALVAWQNEYNELRKITDDEANAQRYRQEEAAFQHRRKMAISKDPDADPLRKDFIIKGIRAEKGDPLVARARQQDRIMASAYLFEYDDRESKIGFQDPLGQRGGVGKGRLRDRPKQTAKAAEADDSNIIHGKRTRKALNIFDGGEATSRGSTPVPGPRRRRRVGPSAEENSDPIPPPPSSLPEVPEQEAPKKKGKGGRPRKHPLPTSIPEDKPMPVVAPEPEPEPEPEPKKTVEEKPTRKRRRRTVVTEEGTTPNGNNTQAPTKSAPRRGNSRLSEVPSGSFYTASSLVSTNPADESRPATSSSTATASTVASVSNSYQLREKRQKKFSLNDSDDDYGDEPKPKRIRRPSKKTQSDTIPPMPEPPVAQQKVPEPPIAPLAPPKTKIKIKNYHPPVPGPTSAPAPAPTSAPISHASPLPPTSNPISPQPNPSNGIPNGITNGIDPSDPTKDYNMMTKSEKMSHSMKARWASGSMSPAVAKRRATLAAKKQAVKSAEPAPAPETVVRQ
ncbi:hypothetical protein F4775DRAFT_548383 [Biscogniauxia sp. FL1348]|nr:hypothetical protein F4775DRAFT_548383 [Biscogniauxia sp. FL1348]